MELRLYNKEQDRNNIIRVWRETGWLHSGCEELVDCVMEAGRTWVAEIDGAAEAEAATARGTIRYLDEELPLTAVTAVSTSLVGRKKGLATQLTALAIANEAEAGALVAGLGMFEQGYYNRLGFGTGTYEHHLSFDPALLQLPVKARTPRRLSQEDWKIMHAARVERMRGHGACSLSPALATRAELVEHPGNTGLGYFDGPDGALSHFIWMGASEVERGPYSIRMMAYQNGQQFLELMALLKDLSDQIYGVRMREPFGIQLQDLIRQPFKNHRISDNSPFEHYNRAAAFWQIRILDLPACLAQTHLPGANLRFNLVLEDPITSLLSIEQTWRGIGGEHIVSLGETCKSAPGQDPSLPVLKTTVNAFTRMWLGIRPASGLALTDNLAGSPELLKALDWAFRLPTPVIDWAY
ncbi:MAG: GNAT family N-acetyltransferase [Anaerolineae bacterium]